MQGVVTLPALFSLAEAATEEFEETEVEEDKEDLGKGGSQHYRWKLFLGLR